MTIDEEIVSLRKSASKSLDYEWQREQYQLADWLEELKVIKDGSIPIIHGKAELELHDKAIRNNAIDDFKSRLKDRILAGKMIAEKFAYIDNCDIDEIAEQLKAGEKNGRNGNK